jgi:hypothetical protein
MTTEVLPIARFRLGNIVTTPQASEKLTFEDIAAAIRRHQAGEWGDLPDCDRAENNLALQKGRALRSVYRSNKGLKFSLVTAADRSVTTVTLLEVNSPPVLYGRPANQSQAALSVAATSPLSATHNAEQAQLPKLPANKIARSLQIEEIGDRWKGFKPRIRIMGQWLERAGFKPGGRVSVVCREMGMIELRAFGSIPSVVNLASHDEIQNPS